MAQRISIGFHASPPLAARVSDQQLADLIAALTGDEGWHRIDSEDGRITLKLGQVLFVRTENEEPRIGFGLSD